MPRATRTEFGRPYASECGCIHTTNGRVEHLGMFTKRLVSVVTYDFCDQHKQQHQASGGQEESSYLMTCRLCVFYFAMSMIALAGWVVTACLYALKP